MTALVEFALFAWVAISVVAVVVQLIRVARFKRSARATESAATTGVTADPPTIDLDERLAATGATDATTDTAADTASGRAVGETAVGETAVGETAVGETAVGETADTTTTGGTVITSRPPTISIAGAAGGDSSTPVPTADTTALEPDTPSTETETASTAASESTADVAEPEPTLADLLAGVRLPWSLLPTVDQRREPANDRVVLMTDEGEPGDIGVDVADELERLGFTITPQGEDTAMATKAGRSLGLRIIPDPSGETVDDRPRFPSAKASSVALEIWIQS